MDKVAMGGAARYLSQARLADARLDELDGDQRPTSEADAYRLQAELHRILSEGGHGDVVGYKIGCTTEVMQRFLNIPNPCAGGVFASTVMHEEGEVRHADYRHAGVECELAVRLSEDVTDAHLDDTRPLADTIESVMAAIELVDDRWNNYTRISTPTLIADDFFGAGCVLGSPRAPSDVPSLDTLRGNMRINGEVVGEGVGRDILGHPLNALRWLATTCAKQGQPLRAGEFVLLGSLVQTVWVKQGDQVTVEIEALGRATLKFS